MTKTDPGGTSIWSVDAELYAKGIGIRSDGTIYVAGAASLQDEAPVAACVDANGTVRWRTTLPGQLSAEDAAVGGSTLAIIGGREPTDEEPASSWVLVRSLYE